jgi:hypothetical protein
VLQAQKQEGEGAQSSLDPYVGGARPPTVDTLREQQLLELKEVLLNVCPCPCPGMGVTLDVIEVLRRRVVDRVVLREYFPYVRGEVAVWGRHEAIPAWLVVLQ